MNLFGYNLSLKRGKSYPKSTYVPKLLDDDYVDFDDPDDRYMRTRKDPIIKRLTIGVANLITSNPPIFLDKNENELKDIRNQWISKGYDNILNDVIKKSRTHGYIVLQPLLKDMAGRDFMVYSSREMIRIEYDKDFNIISYTVLPKLESEGRHEVGTTTVPSQTALDPEKVIHYWIGEHDINQLGLSELEDIWHSCIRVNQILESMAMFDTRIGNGFMAALVDEETYDDDKEIAKLKDVIQNVNNRRGVILRISDKGYGGIKFIGAEGGTLDWESDLGVCLKIISAATGFPQRFLIGDPKGALSAAAEDRIAIWENLKSIFGEYKDFIRKMLVFQDESLGDLIKEIVFDDGGKLEESKDALGDSEEERQLPEDKENE